MFKYAFYVTSLITLFVFCLHVHKAICENDKKYWLREQQSWPSIQKYRNLIKKSKAPEEIDTIRDASYLLPNSRKHQRDEERLDMQVNVRPRFRVDISDKHREDEHRGHAHGRDVAENVHSRESYIRSQPGQTLKGPERPLNMEENSKGLSMHENGDDLQNLKDGPSQQKEENDLYQPRAKIKKQTKVFGKHDEMTTPSNRYSTEKKRLYSEEKIQVTNIGNNFQEEEKISTRGRTKRGRDFDRYKKERDLDKEEQKIDKKEKDLSKIDRSSEERSFDRFKQDRDLDRDEKKINKKEKKGFKKQHHSSEERNFDRYKKEKDKTRQHDKKQREPEGEKEILRERDEDYGREKYVKRVRVTKGFNDIEEPTSKKKDEMSYESIDIISEEQQQSDLHETKKVPYPRYPNLETHSIWPLLRTDDTNDEDALKPFSIAQQLSLLKKKLKNVVVDQDVIGRTSGGYDIVLWKIKEKRQTHRFRRTNVKKKYVDEPPEKKIVFIVHGLSVMGWYELDCLSQQKRFDTLLHYYLENLDSFDIYLIPMANPDGVAKIKLDKWWSKNNSPQYGCPGVNLDRNFDVHWNPTHGRAMSSCNQKYPGQKPFSEHETRAVREVFHRYGHKIVAYFHVHAGTHDATVFKGDAVLYPRGYMLQQTEDDKYVDLKADIDEAMRNTTFKTLSVSVDTLHSWYGEVLGTSVDYASTVIGIPYSLELVMQIYKDCPDVKKPDNREKNAALVEIWQILIDVIFDSIYRNVIKPNEP